MSDCRFGVSPVNYPDPDPETETDVHVSIRRFPQTDRLEIQCTAVCRNFYGKRFLP